MKWITKFEVYLNAAQFTEFYTAADLGFGYELKPIDDQARPMKIVEFIRLDLNVGSAIQI